MAREAKKQGAQDGEVAPPTSLEQLILDQTKDKYTIVPLASYWALELRRMEENRHLSESEILDAAMRDVLTGRISTEQILKAAAVAAAAASRLAEGKESKDKK